MDRSGKGVPRSGRPQRREHSPNKDKSQDPKDQQPNIGSLVKGRYLLLELIASGGTSDIYRARDLAAEPLDERHADLVLKIARASDKEQARFSAAMTRHEALIGRRLRHPNIVAVHDFDREGTLRFVTMEYVPGETLAERLARSPNQRLPKADAIRIAGEVAAAL